MIEENVEWLKLANVDIRCQDATEYMQEQEEKQMLLSQICLVPDLASWDGK